MKISIASLLLLALTLPGCFAGGGMGRTMAAETVARRSARADGARGPAVPMDVAYEATGGLGGDSGGSYGVAYADELRATTAGTTTMSFDDELVAGELATGYRGEHLEEADAEIARVPGVEVERMADAGEVLATAGSVGETIAETATDATPDGPLLVYTGSLWLAVYEVRESQATIVARAEELGGFVQRQTDTELVVRVPAPQFDAIVEAVSGVGDLVHREIAASDVSEEYHDVEIRIRNLEAMRERLEVLLGQATEVEDALRVERELERVTLELESLRGRQRFLDDRISFATVTVHFEARPRDRIDQPEVFALPFYWLANLGLPNLLQLN